MSNGILVERKNPQGGISLGSRPPGTKNSRLGYILVPAIIGIIYGFGFLGACENDALVQETREQQFTQEFYGR